MDSGLAAEREPVVVADAAVAGLDGGRYRAAAFARSRRVRFREPTVIRRLSVHRWASLACVAFVLVLCATGLPLLFADRSTGGAPRPEAAPSAAGRAGASMDALVHAALAAHPGDVPLYVSVDAARDRVRVTTAPTPSARDVHFTTFDRATGARAPQEPAAADDALALARRLHMTLGFGLPGMLFLGAIGVLFIASIGSGLLLPGALALGRDGGERSRGRSPRAAWRLTHARVGVVATAWLVLVGATGVLGTLATPLMSRWERGELAALAAAAGPGGPAVPERVSVGTAIARALDAAPELRLEFVAFPGAAYGAKDHFAVYLRGTTLLTSRLTTTALVDASSGRLVGLRDASWYVQALSLSQPLHSGRFGGWPVKLLWALLTIATIVLCLSGVQLWWARLRRPRASD